MCERVVPRGQARQAGEALALEIARFPQAAVRADRQSAYRQHGLSVRAAMEQEWENGAGKGRHGGFDDI